ncbi:ATP-binding protein [Tannerella serpentiformis]|uniref:ATP-binding protein n=1 Tax=Tannerella serpentiformis TaxID=712710 RepID=UPI000840A53B|nr:ATP-binding protein [Tannerella serpentiformis]AOH40548.1 ATP-binding protein [Tannerella serpentiformis]AVV54449.1 ATP-binding protein [Tannerella serpentiformis]
MILNFSIQNFGSIKDKQTLSFEADKSDHLEEAYVTRCGGRRILKLALLYGANASGKTTVLKALDFLRKLVVEPKSKKTERLDFEPYLFDPDTPKQPTVLSIEFIRNEVRYAYRVEFTQEAVVAEELYAYYTSNKARIYQRTTDLERQFVEIKFGSKMTKSKAVKQSLTANTLWNNTVLGGYLKTNVDSKELQEVVDWFKLYLKRMVQPQTSFEDLILFQMEDGEILSSDMIPILQQADLHISDIVIQSREIVDRQEVEDFLSLINDHHSVMSKGDVIEFREEAKAVIKKVMLEHTVNGEKYQLPLAEESRGTKRYYDFAGLLALFIKDPRAMLIDELESSLHPDLYRHFIVSYLLNTKDSQILATTHNRELLDDRDLFRNDAIWFTDKSNADATELYSLADFDRSVIGKKTNVLNAYKSGKLSGTPILGDTHIDLNHGKN